MSFTITDQRLAVAILEWDDRLFKVYQAIGAINHLIPTLTDIRMTCRAGDVTRVRDDLNAQLVTGELLTRMRRQHAVRHPVLDTTPSGELFRQFNAVAAQFWLMRDNRDDEALARLDIQRSAYIDAATAALSMEA